MHNLLTVKRLLNICAYRCRPCITSCSGATARIQIGRTVAHQEGLARPDILREEEQGQPTVLVIDDDTGVQGMFKLFLKRSGFSRMLRRHRQGGACGAAEAKIRSVVPRSDAAGYDRGRDLRRGEAIAPELPIVIITGYPDSDMLDNILKHGPVTVLKKPLKVEQLSQTLRFSAQDRRVQAA